MGWLCTWDGFVETLYDMHELLFPWISVQEMRVTNNGNVNEMDPKLPIVQIPHLYHWTFLQPFALWIQISSWARLFFSENPICTWKTVVSKLILQYVIMLEVFQLN